MVSVSERVAALKQNNHARRASADNLFAFTMATSEIQEEINNIRDSYAITVSDVDAGDYDRLPTTQATSLQASAVWFI
tara:strand:+ start:452 stop:685 length:234 start_codon:yes stop_codon:yes gene_type:complete